MEPLEAQDPRQVGAYRLLRRLGAGGMGRVFLGRSTGGRTVAVKVVRAELADDAEFRARFRQEVASARQVGGRWTAPVLDADTESAQPWVATGYVAGPALGTAVQQYGPLPEEAVRVLGIGLAGALAAVHGLGLVHRDVKPSNVLLALDGPRLIDFGIARALDTASLTQSGFVVGSPGYMSPEQANGQPAGPPSDVFSLAAVLAYAAAGTAPFGEGVSAAVLLYRVIHEEPDLAGVPDGPLRELLAAALTKRPEDRPTPQEFGQRLAALGPAGEAATVKLGRGGWLPPAVAEAVARQAVELLELEHEPQEPETTTGGTPATTEPRRAASSGAGGGAGGEAGHGAGGESGRGARGWAPAAVAVAAVLALGGGLLAWQPWAPATPKTPSSDSDSPTGTPTETPTRGAAGGATDKPTEQSSDSPTDTSSDSPSATDIETPAAPPSPGPSTPDAIPAAFLGTWSGLDSTATLGQLVGETTTVTIRPAALGAENATSLNTASGGLLSITCEGAWKLTSAGPRKLVFSSRLVRESGKGFCSGGSSTEQLELNADGTLTYTSVDSAAGNPTATLHKVR
ncbi:serine/threonine-protein kinase [Kitasatospora azatica]|uniref:serine/threonine-protein kinase n=1 Tax=Kitasatospora azatica TaxID=58347 RepID=UPI0005629103|nr:serine/threonine-protein kinase [Kitasatospora azatica]